jgi:hypothetical protein
MVTSTTSKKYHSHHVITNKNVLHNLTRIFEGVALLQKYLSLTMARDFAAGEVNVTESPFLFLPGFYLGVPLLCHLTDGSGNAQSMFSP